MSDNDQPSVPPSEPIEPGEPGGQPAQEAAPAPIGPNRGLLIAIALVALLVIGGGITAAVLLAGDDKDESETVSMEEFCDELAAIDDADAYDQELFADAVESAGTPEEMPEDVKKGSELFVTLLDDAEDEAAFQEGYTKMGPDDLESLQSYLEWVGTECFDDEPDSSEE